MATIIKKKKPKVKNKPEADEISKELTAETPEVHADLEQFTIRASTTKDIISHECSIASDFQAQEQDQEDVAVEPVAATEENISLHEELLMASPTSIADPPLMSSTEDLLEPTAPIISVPSAAKPKLDMPPLTLTQYPKLEPLEHVETISQVIYQTPKIKSPLSCLAENKIKPLTGEQLQQIYQCRELELVKQFELEFLMNSLMDNYETDPLYAALQEYYTLQSKLVVNLHDIKKCRAETCRAQDNIWVSVNVTETFKGRCSDNVEVSECVSYNITQVDGRNLENASASASRLFDMVCCTYTTHLVTAKITKVRIDQIINEILSYPGVSERAQHAIVSLHNQLDDQTLGCVAQLRRALTILFSFTRRFSPNETFTADLLLWLRKLVALHLRIATKEDHWFLLFNVLRCPNGVGKWGTEFVQIPGTMKPAGACVTNEMPLALTSPEMNHCIAILQTLLMPIKKRNEYLKGLTQSQKEISDPVREERWILIDSDGEDSHNASGECVGLKESDLIALLNQIPFELLYTSALGIEKFLNDYIIEPDLITASQMMRVVAFCSQLIDIFGEGMITYNNERYKQLAKRLGRLVRHTLQYVTDYYELFIHNKVAKDQGTCDRVTIEMHALLLKACSYIYRTRNLSTWQYFSSLSFGSMHVDAIWQIFYYLNVGFATEYPTGLDDPSELLNSKHFWRDFNVAHADSSPEDLYYLLQTFFEMANERDKHKDAILIKAICLHIFNIGFINDLTRDVCYKTARDMLVNLTIGNDDLISCLLMQMKIHYSSIENASFLFKSLPLENWQPGMDSFEILSNWLLHYDYKSSENILSRIIFSHLNWGFDSEGRLFLPHNIHVRMACLITEALTKHAGELIGLSSISESVRQVSNLIDFTQATKEQFATWCWAMVLLLRLHAMDQSVESRKRTLQNPTETLMFIPELERVDLIYKGVTENRPLALFTALLVSMHGHSIPLICQKGFELLKLLLTDYRHMAVIRCIQVIVPLFLEAPETLANCESFQNILTTLLSADKTYLKMAKDIIYPNSIGPVLEMLDNMIHLQITRYTDYGLTSPLNLINVWLNCLTSLPNWQTTNVVYLLDKILRVAYQFPDARFEAVEFFHNYYKDCDDWKGVKQSTLKSLFTSTQSRIPSLVPQFGWLNLVLLEIEFLTQEIKFWPEFLRQLASGNEKNLEATLKKTAGVVKFTPFSPHMLVIYKYANLVATMDINHPLFPIVNQKFFELYLSRLPMERDVHNFHHTYGVSDKFYEYNLPLMKKIKTTIKAAEMHYTNEATQHVSDEALSYFYRNCADMMKTFSLWLEETSISKQSREQFNYPPQYNIGKLNEIVNGNTTHWTEFIYLRSIRQDQKSQADKWARKCLRFNTLKRQRTPLKVKEKTPPIERIKRNLGSYEKRMESPEYRTPIINVPNTVNANTLNQLKGKLKVLTNTATKYHLTTSELNSLNRNFLDVVVNLYTLVPYEEVRHKFCNSLMMNRKCTGAAEIKAILKNIRTDNNVHEKIKLYHERHDKIIEELLAWNVEEFAQCFDQLNTTLRVLITAQGSDTKYPDLVTRTGVNFFYNIIENLNDITMKFTPTHDLYTQILNDLGVFIQNNQELEGFKILELALKRPDLIKILSAVFVPYRTRPEYFLKMYKFLIDSYLKRCDKKILFVLLSKFELVTWLDTFHPKLYETNNLLELVLRGLECWSENDSTLLQDQFRRHLIHIFNYDFPEHYGEVLQLVLDRVSEQKLMPAVLLDLLNSLLERYSLDALDMNTPMDKIKEISIDFARTQNLFNLSAANETVMLFARHFQKERLNHGLHGLYPKHKNYCLPLAMWFSCFGHTVVVTAICTYQELLADQISDVIFGAIIEMYSPWLVVYTEQNMKQPTSKWIQQLTENGKMLLPWSEQHMATSKIMIQPFVNTLCFVLQNLPSSHTILNHTFSWYIHHFTLTNIEKHIFRTMHEGIAALPWENFKPQTMYIDMLYDSLHKFLPDCHAMLGHIFIRINWNLWFAESFPTIAPNLQTHVISRLFAIFTKFAFEPNIHIHTTTSKILEDAISYPWHLVDYAELDQLFNWFKSSLDPSIILKIPSETNYADRAVLDLFRLVSAMKPEHSVTWSSLLQPNANATAKRILYTRFYVRLLYGSVAKNHKLLSTKEGLRAFNEVFIELLNTMDKALKALTMHKSLVERQREASNLMIEIVVPMQTQSEEASNLMINGIIQWQCHTASPGNLLMLNTLNAIGHMNTFIAGTYTLLEASIDYYFRTSADSSDWHSPTWNELMQILGMSLEKIELMPILRGTNLYTLHIFIIYQMDKIKNIGEQITFMQDLCQLTQNLKTNEYTESRMALVWGVIISRCSKIHVQSELVKKALLMLARHLQQISTQAEGWGDGLLGAIGLKKDVVTNRRRVLTRCLACIVFSMFPLNGQSGRPLPNEQFESALKELTMLLANKKYLDVKPLVVSAVGIIQEAQLPDPRDIPHLVCRLIDIFYPNTYLATIPEVWDFEYLLSPVSR